MLRLLSNPQPRQMFFFSSGLLRVSVMASSFISRSQNSWNKTLLVNGPSLPVRIFAKSATQTGSIFFRLQKLGRRKRVFEMFLIDSGVYWLAKLAGSNYQNFLWEHLFRSRAKFSTARKRFVDERFGKKFNSAGKSPPRSSAIFAFPDKLFCPVCFRRGMQNS